MKQILKSTINNVSSIRNSEVENSEFQVVFILLLIHELNRPLAQAAKLIKTERSWILLIRQGFNNRHVKRSKVRKRRLNFWLKTLRKDQE